MSSRPIGIIVHGATGRIGATQHLKNALTPIRMEGGLSIGEDRVVPHVILVGRDKERLAAIAQENGGAPWTVDLDQALSDPAYAVLFDAAATPQRKATLEKAIAAGKHIYSEKPVALTAADGRALLATITARGLKHGVGRGQAVPSRHVQAAGAGAGRLFRPRDGLPAGIRLVGVRRL
jgi:predicted dehydrogenase